MPKFNFESGFIMNLCADCYEMISGFQVIFIVCFFSKSNNIDSDAGKKVYNLQEVNIFIPVEKIKNVIVITPFIDLYYRYTLFYCFSKE